MKARRKRSVSGQLMLLVLLTTTLALMIAGSALLLTDLRSSQRAWTDDLVTEGSILALAITPALSFDDRSSANRNLAALQARPSIRAATLYSADGKIYASYLREGETPPPRQITETTPYVRAASGTVELLRPIEQNGEHLGTIHLRAHHDVMGRVLAYAGILLVVGLLSLAAALLASRRLQRVITEPLNSMADVARAVVGEHDHSQRATKATNDEIGLVVDAFNNMLDEVQSQTRALKETERALREADRRKDEFLATLAHELRNPLAPIRNAVRILEIPSSEERQLRWAREVIARQVHNMALLLDDLLDVSRITRGRLELKKECVALGAIVDVAVETARPLLEAKQHTFILNLPAQEITLEADPLRLSQVIANLLTNAAKYTDPAGRVTLTVALLDDELLISVQDTGIGLAAASIPGLFTMFSQVDSAIDRTQGGLGIGLGLVKGLTALHGGIVEARSEGLGRGSEFLVHLPRSIVTLDRRVQQPRPDLHTLSLGQRRRILVADDNSEAAKSLATLFELSGFEVFVAYNGDEALKLASRERPDAILLDIGMPGMSGYEVARRIRLEAWGRDRVLIAVTGWGQEDDKLQARAAGFDEHVTKPVDPKQLERMVVAFLSVKPPTPTQETATGS